MLQIETYFVLYCTLLDDSYTGPPGVPWRISPSILGLEVVNCEVIKLLAAIAVWYLAWAADIVQMFEDVKIFTGFSKLCAPIRPPVKPCTTYHDSSWSSYQSVSRDG